MQNMELIFFISLFIFFMTSSINLKVGHGQSTFNVYQYGAKGDGNTDDSAAFMQAWEVFCGASEDEPTLIIPHKGIYLLSQQINFKGPCHSNKPRINVNGTITLGPYNTDAGETCWKTWLSISQVTSLTVFGDGIGMFDGLGLPNKARQVSNHCKEKPTALVFYDCVGLKLSDTSHVNGPGVHIKVVQSREVILQNLFINSSGKRRQGGIDIENSTGVYIYNSEIITVEDCIAIKGGSYFINIAQITCETIGSNGISVGDLGYNGQEDIVENVNVWDSQLNSAGMKIKTWPGGKGYARSISFHHITVDKSKDPILIDQHYYNGSREQRQAVKVSDVTFSDIRGTSIDERAIVLDCAEIACENIKLNQISISSIDPDKPASAICNHAYGTSYDTEPPTSSCLNHLI